jgi:hypothetical protein
MVDELGSLKDCPRPAWTRYSSSGPPLGENIAMFPSSGFFYDDSMLNF